jgi:two-component system cell cycle sensor histidine kinase/response regulator CckA
MDNGIAKSRSEPKRQDASRRDSERTLRAIFDSAMDGILVADVASREFIEGNEAMCRMLACTRAELLTLGVKDIHPEDRLDAVAEQFERQAAGESSFAQDIPVRRRDGAVFFADVNASPVELDGRRCLIGIFRDNSRREAAEKALRDAEEQLRQSQKLEAIGRLAAGIAHDFNNVLTVILGRCARAGKGLDDQAPIARDIAEIQSCANRAVALTRQLLAFGRKQPLLPMSLDLNRVVSNLEQMLRRLIGEDVLLSTVLADGLGYVKADPGQIEQVLMNLAVNARDAMPRGGRLTIETAGVDLDPEYARNHVGVTPGPHVMLAVSDTGCGMDAETKKRIFEPFFTTKEKGRGTGLGLSTVYGIVKQSGGHIWLYSEVGQGTTYKIYFPRAAPATGEAVARQSQPVAPARGGSETILIAEDEAPLRLLVGAILEEAGYRVLIAANGHDAIRLCQNHPGPIELLISDVVMPHMGGKQLSAELKDRRPGIKILFASGYTDNVVIHHEILSPGVAFIQKPFTPNELLAKVRTILDGPR